MIELSEKDLRKEQGSSKGNQLKWLNGDYWHKADYTGYEGFSEYVCSKLLKNSTLSDAEYVDYETEKIKYKSTILTGCKSLNMLPKGWQLITIERLVKQRTGMSLGAEVYKINKLSDRLAFIEKQVVNATGLADFGI